MNINFFRSTLLLLLLPTLGLESFSAEPSAEQLARWLKRFPQADTNRDGKLSAQEADAFRARLTGTRSSRSSRPGAPPEPQVDAGWKEDRFPDHAMCYRSPEEIAKAFEKIKRPQVPTVVSYDKPEDGSLRIVGTGHSFMIPGYRTFPKIVAAAGFDQPPLLTHTGGGMTGSARYKWEQENGIFQFDKRPTPRLLASIANSEWDVMTWGPYFHDRPEYYTCWIDFCLKYSPNMKFYLSDAWPQIDQLPEIPKSENELTAETFRKMGAEKNAIYQTMSKAMNDRYPGRFFIMPTSDAMVIAAEHYFREELPGVEGIHRFIGGKQRSLWNDRLGHLGPGFDRLEGYVFFATLYGRSPETIDGDISFGGEKNFPSRELDRTFRKIAWQAALRNPASGVVDRNSNGVSDERE